MTPQKQFEFLSRKTLKFFRNLKCNVVQTFKEMAKYYSEDERKTRLESNLYRGIWFESCVDLSEPVKIHGYKSRKELGLTNETELASAVGSFIADWAVNLHPRLNGFNGTDCIKWEIAED